MDLEQLQVMHGLNKAVVLYLSMNVNLGIFNVLSCLPKTTTGLSVGRIIGKKEERQLSNDTYLFQNVNNANRQMSSDLNMQLGREQNRIGLDNIMLQQERRSLALYIDPCAEYCVFHLHLQKEFLESDDFANNKHW